MPDHGREQGHDVRELPTEIVFSSESGSHQTGCCEWSTTGSIITEESAERLTIDLSGGSQVHHGTITLQSGMTIDLEAGFGLLLFDQLLSQGTAEGISPEVCGTCIYFAQSGMISEWSFGFEGYCRVDRANLDYVFSNIFSRCKSWREISKINSDS
jgi:hypothetical protein